MSSKNESLTDKIRNKIYNNYFIVGQSLKQDYLANLFGVSKIPIREALISLEAEGLVEFIANRGAIVKGFTIKEAIETNEIRIVLEKLALKKSLNNNNEFNIKRAELILMEIETIKDKDTWHKLNWEFHYLLYKNCNMPNLINIIKRLHNSVNRYFKYYMLIDTHFNSTQKEHREIIKACKKDDSKKACLLLENHLNSSTEKLVSFLKGIEKKN